VKPTADQIRRYVEDRFRGQRIGSKAEAKLRCPFHDDRDPSLSWNLEKGVWKCHAGCGEGGLIDFEQKLNGGSREEAGTRIAEIMHADHLFESHRTKPVAIYPYHDAQGRLLFEKLRYDPKRFVQRRPIGRTGQYEYKLGNIAKPLYRLTEVITANVILVAEGEKDVDRLAALKLGDDNTRVAATTNFDGAGKWRDADSVYCAGKRVVIFPDNDQAGRDHAEKVALSVSKHASGVRVVNLPGLLEKEDVSDYLNTHTKEELIAEIKNAPAWKSKDQPHVMLVEAIKFAVSAPMEVDWAVEGVIERGSNGIFAAEPKAGKTLCALDLSLGIATGTSWLGFRVPRRMKCGLVSREDFPGMTARRIGQLYRGSDVERRDLEGWLWINTRAQTPNFQLEDESAVDNVIREFREEHVEFACFDVFRRLHAADENDNSEMARILAVLTRIQQEVGCALALVHHVNREVNQSIFRRIRGASAIHGWLEWGVGITVVNELDPPRQWIRQVQFECKSACAQPPKYFRIEDTGDNLRLTLTEAPESARPRPVKNAASFMKGSG